MCTFRPFDDTVLQWVALCSRRHLVLRLRSSFLDGRRGTVPMVRGMSAPSWRVLLPPHGVHLACALYMPTMRRAVVYVLLDLVLVAETGWCRRGRSNDDTGCFDRSRICDHSMYGQQRVTTSHTLAHIACRHSSAKDGVQGRSNRS